ncbi:MAG: DUF5107 domain-containing protein [Planctomycetes bacterium]|nr:DUF5107 domain-containing protein [Planctomycetota bacterium]
MSVATVRVWTEGLVIPTYKTGELSRLAAPLHEGYGRIYPYTRNDDLTNNREDVEYTAAYVENEHLKVTVLPELGGHIYGVYNKMNDTEIFYRNCVVKPGLVGLRGAWIPTGIEFNFPIGHTVTTALPVDYALVEEEGFSGVEVSDVELASGMRWSVTIGLYPGSTLIATRVRLYNQTEISNRYYYWANAALLATEGTEFIVDTPAAWTWRGLVNFPIHKGRNIAWYKNFEVGADVFTLGGKNDFFGAYDHTNDIGVVNVASLDELPGRKFFTWGGGARGEVWERILSEGSGPYIEIQRGRFPTQADYGFIDPGEVLEWTEHWYPVYGMDGFVAANLDAAANMSYEGTGAGKTAVARLNVTKAMAGRLIIEEKGRSAAESEFDIRPGEVHTVRAKVGDVPENELAVRVVSNWREVLRYSPRGPEEIREEDYAEWIPQSFRAFQKRRGRKRKEDGEAQKVEAVYKDAVENLKHDLRRAAGEKLKKVLKLDPENVAAMIQLGGILIWQLKYVEAAEILKKAVTLDRDQTRGSFYLGVAKRRLGDMEGAAEALYRVARRSIDIAHAARWELGEIAAVHGHWEEALYHLSHAVDLSARADMPAVLRAAVLRRMGRPDEALEEAGKVALRQATDGMAENEMRLAYRAMGDEKAAGRSEKRLVEKHSRTVQRYIGCGLAYARAGMYAEAREILEMYSGDKVRDTDGEAMLYYYLAMVLKDMGARQGEIKAALSRAAGAGPERVYPNRSEAERALRLAVEADPKDANARLFLGNLYASRYRPDDALGLLREAEALQPGSDLILRSLGYVNWVGLGKKRKALEYYKKAIGARRDHDTVCEADRLMSEAGARADRDELWANMPEALLAQHNEVRTRCLHYLADSGKYDKAIELLGKHIFYSSEGGFATRRMYDDVHLYTAMKYMRRGQYEKALEEMETVREYPKNLLIDTTVHEAQSRLSLIRGDILAALGRKSEARKEYMEGAAEKLEWATPAYYFKGLCEKRLGRKKQVLKTAEELQGRLDRREVFWLYLDPVEELFLRALVALLKGEKGEAAGHIKEVIRRRPYHRWGNYLKKHGMEVF